ncbi:hypothetical protein [Nocardia barduliensis]|nr:hypothetical protein [Nocardia barduliensis]
MPDQRACRFRGTAAPQVDHRDDGHYMDVIDAVQRDAVTGMDALFE